MSTLKVYAVRHQGQDRRAVSTVAATSETQAVDLIRAELANHELSHVHGRSLRAEPVKNATLTVTKAGIVGFDVGRRR